MKLKLIGDFSKLPKGVSFWAWFDIEPEDALQKTQEKEEHKTTGTVYKLGKLVYVELAH